MTAFVPPAALRLPCWKILPTDDPHRARSTYLPHLRQLPTRQGDVDASLEKLCVPGAPWILRGNGRRTAALAGVGRLECSQHTSSSRAPRGAVYAHTREIRSRGHGGVYLPDAAPQSRPAMHVVSLSAVLAAAALVLAISASHTAARPTGVSASETPTETAASSRVEMIFL